MRPEVLIFSFFLLSGTGVFNTEYLISLYPCGEKMKNQGGIIGMFDSGVGGLTVLAECIRVLPGHRWLFFADSRFAPYGDRSRDEIRARCFTISDPMIHRGAKAIVVACNTATSSAINDMRQRYSIPIVGMEPALKPATEADLPGKVLVMGTSFTIREAKYRRLLERFEGKREIVSVACPGLVPLIEEGAAESPRMHKRLEELFSGLSLQEFGAIVLGCTHFVFFKNILRRIFGDRPVFFDGNHGTALQLKRVLGAETELNGASGCDASLVIDTSGPPDRVFPLCRRLLKGLDIRSPEPVFGGWDTLGAE